MAKPYIQLFFQPVSPEQSEILIATLSAAGFEGFEEEEQSLKAFIAESNWDEETVQAIIAPLHIPVEKTMIPEA